MLMTAEEARIYLNNEVKELRDEEVEQLVEDAELLARLCLDVYLKSRSGNKV